MKIESVPRGIAAAVLPVAAHAVRGVQKGLVKMFHIQDRANKDRSKFIYLTNLMR